jgi:cell division protein FtsZ
VLINITGGYDLTLFELDEAANRIREEVDPDANIIVGSTLDPSMEGMMRVSVVATGIDATEAAAEMPVPRRSMARPLDQPARVEEPVRAAPVEPAPVARRQPEPETFVRREPEQARRQPEPEPEEEPSLFGGFEPSRAGREAAPMYDEDNLPEPAYRHEPAAQAPMTPAQPRQAGMPSPEALARLQAAVRRAPPADPRLSAPPRAPEPQTERAPRFGINSLINRMTGHQAEQAPRPAPAARQQPQLRQPVEEEELSPEQEKIEIPAFLRRQAN